MIKMSENSLSSLEDIILDFDLEMRRLEDGLETTRA